MAWNVLHHRQHAAGLQPFGCRGAERGDGCRIATIRPVADCLRGTLYQDIEHRQAVDGNTEPGSDRRHAAATSASRTKAGAAVGLVDLAQARGWRIGLYVWRAMRWTRPPSWSINTARRPTIESFDSTSLRVRLAQIALRGTHVGTRRSRTDADAESLSREHRAQALPSSPKDRHTQGSLPLTGSWNNSS